MAEQSPRKPHSRDNANALDQDAARESATDGENEGLSSPRNRITRAVGKGVDNLTRSFSGNTRPSAQQQTAGSPPPGPRRLFSLKRKGKGKESDSAYSIPLACCVLADVMSSVDR